MIKVNQLKLPIEHSESALEHKLLKTLHISGEQLISYTILKQSIDSRKKNELYYVYVVSVELQKEKAFLSYNKNPNIVPFTPIKYTFPAEGTLTLKDAPVIIGSGPAGLFCGYELALHGYKPVIIERGMDVEHRTVEVEKFWQTGVLNTKTNVQFGEGGAGTFSDGKLNTLVKDVAGRNREVLEIFVKMGAPEDILYINKPHIGTDILKNVVKNLRQEIVRLGGSVCFEEQLTALDIKNQQLTAIELNTKKRKSVQALVLAVGHSARDTFAMLHQAKLDMEAKAFAVGMRVEHPQEMINMQQYKGANSKMLPAASYKLTANTQGGRGVYSFCMCPGGYVVNASSEEDMLAVNGMSYHDRAGANANSAIIVSVTPEDYQAKGPLSGIVFQRELEHKAYMLGQGAIPQQLYGDFKDNKASSSYGDYESTTKGAHCFANLRTLFPKQINEAFIEGMEHFSRYIKNYNRSDAILSGVESRTSSPVRITRDENYESNIKGIYPCGEGAGYAGGIMSAAMDGLKVAETIAAKYHSMEGSNEVE